MENFRRPSINDTNFLFLILALFLLTVGTFVQARDIYKGLIITEYLIILIPNLIFLKSRGMSIKKVLKVKPLGLYNAFLITLITLLSYPLVVFINGIFLSFISIFKDINPSPIPVPIDDIQFLYSIFVVAIGPGICEEVMFRGTVMTAYERLGAGKGIIITSLLFGLFHFNILNLIGPLILGVIFGIMVYRTGSIYSSILAHTINNAIAISFVFFMSKYGDVFEQIDLMEPLSDKGLWKLIIFSTILIISLLIIIPKLLRKLSNISHDEIDEKRNLTQRKRKARINYLPILISLGIYIYVNWRFVLQ